jgi:sporulation protein YlmC with PRC-barrel domain
MKYGKLIEVLLDPTTLQATDIIVEQDLPTKPIQTLPVTLIERTTAAEIFLSLRCEEVVKYGGRHFKPGKRTGGEYNSYLKAVVLGMPVYNQQGVIGRLDGILLDLEKKEITHLVICEDGKIADPLTLPISSIETVDENGILVVMADRGA